jgi:3-deoxy-D-manno-octulosonic-acid transferase
MKLLLFIAYNALQIIATPFVCIYLYARKLKNKPILGRPRERFGLVPKPNKDHKKIIWIHAASVGETLAVQTHVDELKKNDPSCACYLTVGTMSGYAIAHKQINADYISLMPLDYLPCMLGAFWRIRPHAIMIVEAEHWPNFMLLAYYLSVPLYALNARMSARSHTHYHKLRALLRPLLDCFKTIYTQSQHDKEYFESLGIASYKIQAPGNIKLLNVLKKQQQCIAASKYTAYTAPEFQTLLAGSIHPGEDVVYIELFTRLKKEIPGLKLILAPRHFHWKETLLQTAQQSGYTCLVVDETTTTFSPPDALKTYDILLICKLGLLFELYQNATLFFLGGTFVGHGGHNVLEPAVWSVPTILGPAYHNCTIDANALEASGGLTKVKTTEELYQTTRAMLLEMPLTHAMGSRARRYIENNSTALAEHIKELSHLLG